MMIRSLIGRTICSASCLTRTNFVQDTILQRLIIKKNRRALISGKKHYATYEGDGKTVGFVLNKKNSKVLMLDCVGVDGFVLSNGRELVGSIIIFPNSILAWNVLTPEDVNEESLTLFKLLDPKIDILLFGYGSSFQYTKEVKEKFTGICKKLGIRFEALPTHQAAGLYNFLADDGRFVAAALIPPAVVDKLRFDRRKHLYLQGEVESELLEEEEALNEIENADIKKLTENKNFLNKV